MFDAVQLYLGSGPTPLAARSAIPIIARASPSLVVVAGETGTGKDLVVPLLHDTFPEPRSQLITVDGTRLSNSRDAESYWREHVSLATGGTLYVDGLDYLGVSGRRLLEELFTRMQHPGPAPARVFLSSTRYAQSLEGPDFPAWLKARGPRRLDLPPLRWFPVTDLEVLAAHFLNGRKRLAAGTLSCLARYRWPGNVRELFNVLEAACVESGSQSQLRVQHLPVRLAAVAV